VSQEKLAGEVLEIPKISPEQEEQAASHIVAPPLVALGAFSVFNTIVVAVWKFAFPNNHQAPDQHLPEQSHGLVGATRDRHALVNQEDQEIHEECVPCGEAGLPADDVH
jgi:hypothetical protein